MIRYILCRDGMYLNYMYIWVTDIQQAALFPEWQLQDVLELSEGLNLTPTHFLKVRKESTGEITELDRYTKQTA